jgi:hypothetical protein
MRLPCRLLPGLLLLVGVAGGVTAWRTETPRISASPLTVPQALRSCMAGRVTDVGAVVVRGYLASVRVAVL